MLVASILFFVKNVWRIFNAVLLGNDGIINLRILEKSRAVYLALYQLTRYVNEGDNHNFSEWKIRNIFLGWNTETQRDKKLLVALCLFARCCTRAACQIILSTTTMSKNALGGISQIFFPWLSIFSFQIKNCLGEDTVSSPRRPFYLISHNEEAHGQTEATPKS